LNEFGERKTAGRRPNIHEIVRKKRGSLRVGTGKNRLRKTRTITKEVESPLDIPIPVEKGRTTSLRGVRVGRSLRSKVLDTTFKQKLQKLAKKPKKDRPRLDRGDPKNFWRRGLYQTRGRSPAVWEHESKGGRGGGEPAG